MTITLNMLLHRLFQLSPQLRDHATYLNSSVPIQGIRVLSKVKESHPVGYLYLCDSSHGILQGTLPEDLLLVLVLRPDETGPVHPAAVVLRTDDELEFVLNTFWSIFLFFRDWDKELHIATIQNKGIQFLLQISEKVIGNPITVIDTSMALLACSRQTESRNRIFNELREGEYVPPHLIQLFQEEQYYDDLRKRDVRFTKNNERVVDEDVIYALRVQNRVVAHVTMICEKYPFEETTELFDNLVLCLQQQAERDYHFQSSNRFVFENLMIDLLSGKGADETTARHRLAILDIPFESRFYLLVLQIPEHDGPFPEYLASNVSNLLPATKVLPYRGDIVVLLDAAREHREAETVLEACVSRIMDYLKDLHISVGISELFLTLSELKTAYVQASAGPRLAKRLGKANEGCVHDYRDYKMYDLLQGGRPEAELRRFCSRSLTTILAQDMENRTDYANLLYTYLKTDRRVTETANRLHMHRNNVIYHIGKLEERYHLQLDRYEVRLSLLLSFELLRICGDFS